MASMIKVNVKSTEEVIGTVIITSVSQTITIGAFKRRIQVLASPRFSCTIESGEKTNNTAT
jgi:hypothetical protein